MKQSHITKTGNDLIDATINRVGLRLSGRNVLRCLLEHDELKLQIGDEKDRPERYEAIKNIIEDILNNGDDSYKRHIAYTAYALVEQFAQVVEDGRFAISSGKNPVSYVMENYDLSDFQDRELRLSVDIASRLLPTIYPTGYSSWRLLRNFGVHNKEMTIIGQLQKALAKERNRALRSYISNEEIAYEEEVT